MASAKVSPHIFYVISTVTREKVQKNRLKVLPNESAEPGLHVYELRFLREFGPPESEVVRIAGVGLGSIRLTGSVSTCGMRATQLPRKPRPNRANNFYRLLNGTNRPRRDNHHGRGGVSCNHGSAALVNHSIAARNHRRRLGIHNGWNGLWLLSCLESIPPRSDCGASVCISYRNQSMAEAMAIGFSVHFRFLAFCNTMAAVETVMDFRWPAAPQHRRRKGTSAYPPRPPFSLIGYLSKDDKAGE